MPHRPRLLPSLAAALLTASAVLAPSSPRAETLTGDAAAGQGARVEAERAQGEAAPGRERPAGAAAAPSAGRSPAVSAVGDAALARHAQTCRHFENRARFAPRGADAPFTARFADTCRAALGMARRAPPAPGAALSVPPEVYEARLYLARLTRLRLEIAAMNRARLYGEGAGRRAEPRAPAPGKGGGAFGQVSHYGEYLIARDLGVMRALQRWTAATMRLAHR